MLNWLRGRRSQPETEQPAPPADELAATIAQAEPEPEPEPSAPVAPAAARRSFFGRMADMLRRRPRLDESTWEELEDLLIQADVGVPTTMKLLDTVRQRQRDERLSTGDEVRAVLQEELVNLVSVEPRALVLPSPLAVILVVGVNGVGKTTTIAKLARWLQRNGRHSVMLAAGDTFRAAAIEQLREWGERTGTPVVAHQMGADPGSVVFDAIQAAESRGADVVIVDTAGRLHTKFNLMEEMKKIARVADKRLPGAPHETLLVLDAITGQNGLVQAREFQQAVELTGVIITKLDGTAKGGIAFAICDQLALPIKFVGTGERADSLAPFDPAAFVAALFE